MKSKNERRPFRRGSRVRLRFTPDAETEAVLSVSVRVPAQKATFNLLFLMTQLPDNKTKDALNLVDGDIIDRVRMLELFSRFRVEGILNGNNLSPYKGFTADFLQHRQYFKGDSLKYLDWRVYGKTEKLYIREYEELTNARISFVLDISNSMSFKGKTELSKLDFAIRCIALMCYIAFMHKDSFSLICFNTKMTSRIPFGSGKKHLHRILRTLIKIAAEGETDFLPALRDATSQVRHKGLTVFMSDFMDDPERIVPSISRLRYQGSDVIAMQIEDITERELDFVNVTRFHDLEGPDIISIDPILIKEEYQKEYENHQIEMKKECQKHGFEYTSLQLDDEFEVPLLEYLRKRMELFM